MNVLFSGGNNWYPAIIGSKAVVSGKTVNVGHKVSVSWRYGEQNEGKNVSKRCIVTGLTGEDSGSRNPLLGRMEKLKDGLNGQN